MEVGINFKNIISYNENMAKGLADKLFFLEHLNISKDKSYIFVDFGCADGTLLDALYEIMERAGVHAYYIGYDISDTMIDFAKTKFSHRTDSIMFTTKWADVKEKVTTWSRMESVLILSSVIHEVYSYAECEDDINLFWHRVLNSNFKYICVRDMMPEADIERKTPSDIYNKFNEHFICGDSLLVYRDEFEKIWGNTWESNKQFIHFLLKYRWTINWDREVDENYFPIYVHEFLNIMKMYNINYLNRFRVPFLDKCWKEDFNIEIEDYTHIKAIFEKSK